MWSLETYWNPLFFVSTWVSATLLMYSFGPSGYPGWRRHLALALVSVPIWWWFELINARVQNWKYIILFEYGDVGYALLPSLAFSTVVPAASSASRALRAGEIVAGAVSLALLLALPAQFFILVWVAPFLILDGVVGLR